MASSNISLSISKSSNNNQNQFASKGSYRRVPGFLADLNNATYWTNKSRSQSLEQLIILEEEERLRRTSDLQGEAQRRSLAAQMSARFSAIKQPSLRKTTAGLNQRNAWEFEFMGAALGSPERFSTWEDASFLEEAERVRRFADMKGEGLKRSLAAKTSALFLVGWQSIKLRPVPEFLVYAAVEVHTPTALEAGVDAVVDSAKSIGNLALRAAQFFGYKALEGAQNLAVKAADKGPIIAEKAQALGGAALDGAAIVGEKAAAGALIAADLAVEGAAIAAEKAAIGAQNLGELAIEGAQIAAGKAAVGAQIAADIAVTGAQNLGVMAKEGAQIAAESAVTGAQIAAGAAVTGAQTAAAGAQTLGHLAKEGAQNLAGQAQDLAGAAADAMIDLWEGSIYTLSWNDLTILEETERQWRMASLNSLDRFMLALNVSNLIKDYIRINDASFYQPRRHYGTAVLEEFERIRRLLEFRSDKLSRSNANRTAKLIQGQLKRAKHNERYMNWTTANTKAFTQGAQSAQAQQQSWEQPRAPLAQPAKITSTTVTTATTSILPAASATNASAGAAKIWGPTARSQWSYIPPAETGFLSYGTYKQATAWQPTSAEQLLQQAAQQQPQRQSQAQQQSQGYQQQGMQQARQQMQSQQQGIQQGQQQQGWQQGFSQKLPQAISQAPLTSYKPAL